jgi:YYY domain-containing protein
MALVLLWWLCATCIGWLAWPLTACLFKHSPNHGYAFSHALGLILLAFPCWLMNVTGLVPHTATYTRLIALILALIMLGLAWMLRRNLHAWFIQSWRSICVIELLYLVTFAMFCLYKSYTPAIQHTEQPMDLMMLRTLLRSAQVPPADPWLAGYQISYYYGGYYIIAQVAQISATPAGIAYNLGLATTFATTAITAYGVFYDLIVPRAQTGKGISWPGMAWSLAGVVALLGSSNPAGLILWGEHLFKLAPTTWLRALGGASAVGYEPWWWFASRAITDPNFIGRSPALITEFPAFSFILGDLHPHLMALPFVLLSLGLTVEVGYRATQEPWWRIGLCWLAPLVIGILGWINTWDLPTFTLTLVLVYGLISRRRGRLAILWLVETLAFGFYLISAGLILFLPFYLSLTTQVQGIGVLYYSKTALLPFILTSGTLLVPIVALLLHRQPGRRRYWWYITVWLGVAILPWVLTALISSPGRTLLGLVIVLLRGPWVLLLLSLVITLAGIRLFRHRSYSPENTPLDFTYLFALVGCGLLYGVEFFYVRDMFQNRMNSLFKVSYQAWVLLSIAAVLAVWHLVRSSTKTRWLVWAGGIALAFGCAFTLSAVVSISQTESGTPSLDGAAYLAQIAPGDYGAIRWLEAHADAGAIMVEGVNSDYGTGNRLSAFSGVPTLLGWPGHEWQWRGSGALIEQRQRSVEIIYTNTDQAEVLAILKGYGVRYLYVGPNEVTAYHLDNQHLAWFGTFLTPVYSQTTATLYKVP